MVSSSSVNSATSPLCIAIVVAAGRGARMATDLPKQYMDMGGEPLIRRTLRAFCSHPGIDGVLPVIHPDDAVLFADAAQGLDVMAPVPGGATRQESVRLGLESLASLSFTPASAPARVLIHDAARAFVSASLIASVIEALNDHPAAIPGIRVVDTLKREDKHGLVRETVERSGLWRAQTPQGFRFPEILAAHREFMAAALTDDSAIAERAGLEVALVEGEEGNVKITTTGDLDSARRKLTTGVSRTGMGFDVHRFCDGDAVTLCGVTVPHTHSLAGHSDADVAMHALTDALLGAMAAGDIGSHFPPSEAQWRDAPSEIFLRHAVGLLSAKFGRVVNVDVTIICETPKIDPHRIIMAERLAAILGVAGDQVSVKATTTERLGFTGRGEGIAAQAVATIILP